MADESRWPILIEAARTFKDFKIQLPKVLIGLGIAVLLALLFPRGEVLELDYKVGAIWAQKDLIAPFSFPIFREEKEYTRDVEDAKKKAFTVFERDTASSDRQLERLDQFFTRLDAAIALRADKHRIGKYRSASDSVRFTHIAEDLDIPFSEREWDVLATLSASGRLKEIHSFIGKTAREYYRIGILDRNKAGIALNDIALRKGTSEEIIGKDKFYDQSDVVNQLERQTRSFIGTDRNGASVTYKIAIMHLAPNVTWNSAATSQAIAAAVDAVPRTLGFVQENERVVSKHERITPETKQRLESLARVKADRGSDATSPAQFLGTMLHVSSILALYGIYLVLFRKRIVANSRRIALIAFLILLEGLFAYLTREFDTTSPIEYLILVPVASMLLTIMFDSRVGFYGTVIIAFIVAGIRGSDYTIALASLCAGALAVYSVRDMKIRTQIFRSLGFIFLGYGVVIVALGLERSAPMNLVGEQLLYGLINAVVSPVLTYGLLIFLEKVFRVTTDLTLMELAHFNHPLLRMLAEQAPGTYQHSMQMAGLAETAAAAVGANTTLARVGAYFHDVGKIVKPTYFVENQKGTRNRHDKLTPRMSSLIIAAHVKDGMALAREHGLPEEIVEFIPMHHGTTRIDFFYRKALQLAQDSTDETKLDEIKESDYRYPGPRPQSKETAIMMLADAAEAAVRTIDDPTPQRIEQAIDELVKKRFEEGELDECPLTLKDLTKIKAAFLSVFIGVYHTRVKYPGPEKKRIRKSRAADHSGEIAEGGPMQPAAETAEEQPPAETKKEEPRSDDKLTRMIREIDKE